MGPLQSRGLIEEVVGPGTKRVLVIGVGGGGDVVGSIPTYLEAVREGLDAMLGSILWERFVSDPKPGPIELRELVNAEPLGEFIAWVGGETEAIREGVRVKPQLSIASRELGVRGLGVSLAGAVASIADELAEWVESEGVGAVVAIDVGGDSLAEGWEDNLFSPLADAYSLAVLKALQARTGVRVVLGVAGPGVDGELGRDCVLSRISLIAKEGGYLGAYGVTKSDYLVVRRVLDASPTEASRIMLEASRGLAGEVPIRGGSRRAVVDISSSITYYLDFSIAAKRLPLIGVVEGSRSVWEASRALNEMGVMTEINVEEEAYRFYKSKGRLPEGREYAELYHNARKRVSQVDNR